MPETNTHHAMWDRVSWEHQNELSSVVRNHALWKVVSQVSVHNSLHAYLPSLGIAVPPRSLLRDMIDMSGEAQRLDMPQGMKWNLAIADLSNIAATSPSPNISDHAYNMSEFLREQAYILGQHNAIGFNDLVVLG